MFKGNDYNIDEIEALLDELFEEPQKNEITELGENMIILSDEDGNDIALEFLDLIEYKGEEYIVLLPTEEGDSEVVILRVDEIGTEEETYVSVEDDSILMAVYDIFKEKFKDEFNFVD